VYAPANGLEKGAYVLADLGDSDPEIILMATGSEVSLIVGAGECLASEGVNVRLVSFPSWELFEAQDEAYRNHVFPPSIKLRLSVEAAVSQGWEKWVGESGSSISVERYGASAPYKVIFEHYGFTVDNVFNHACELLAKHGE
jgi:transketolase